MDATRPRRGGNILLNLLVGVEVGLFGGLVMLAWYALISPILGDPWWLIHNLYASQLYGNRDVRPGPGTVTWVGSALHLIVSGVVGALNGLLTPGGRVFGLGVAGACYLFCYFFLWKRIAPLLLIQASQFVLMSSYILYGSMLGWHSHFVAYARGTTAMAGSRSRREP
jgi:hypothetical protein